MPEIDKILKNLESCKDFNDQYASKAGAEEDEILLDRVLLDQLKKPHIKNHKI